MFILSYISLFCKKCINLIEKKWISDIDISIYVMIISIIITGFLVFYLVKVGKETNHLTLKADILHYKTNLFTNVWIIVSLILIKITGFHILDAHSVWDKIEFQIKNIIPNAQINIHLDPFDDSNRDFCKI